MYENSDKFVLNRKSRFSHFEVCCSYTFIRKPERTPNKKRILSGKRIWATDPKALPKTATKKR
jgi:hypothetical protein